MADLDVVAAIDALAAEWAPDDAATVFEAASARDYAGLETEAGPTAAFLALSLASRGDERDAASVALTALADYLPIYAASVRGYAINLRD